jgi:triacylglycerol esterase/lipase EstA (alpha/beta hydrolase family)
MKLKKYLILILFIIQISKIVFAQADTRKYDYLLIHGIASSPEMWDGSLVRSTILSELKKNSLLHAAYNDENSINLAGTELKTIVESRTGDETILIGHSMGGLVSRAFLKQYGPERVSTIISIGTPHSGAKIATEEGMGAAHQIIYDLVFDLQYAISVAYDRRDGTNFHFR